MTVEPVELDEELLAFHPLPDPSGDAGKHDRGTVLVVGATVETPGALLLAGLAALRVGAGRLQLAAPRTVAPLLAVWLPEAQVIGFDVDPSGTVAPSDRLAEAMATADAVLIGSGLGDQAAGQVLLDAALASMTKGEGRLVVDAGALVALGTDPALLDPLAERAVAIPNSGEAEALGADDPDGDDPSGAVSRLVERMGCVVAVRGPETSITAPQGAVVVERNGLVGLATSGSGDVLAGMVAGHLARGADPFCAVLWAVHLHAAAGRALVDQGGELGLLAHELIDVLPGVRASAARTLQP